MPNQDDNKFVTQKECNERRSRIAEDYESLKKRVDNHGREIDLLSDDNIRTGEHIKSIENTFSVLAKIMISVVAAIILLIVRGALKL